MIYVKVFKFKHTLSIMRYSREIVIHVMSILYTYLTIQSLLSPHSGTDCRMSLGALWSIRTHCNLETEIVLETRRCKGTSGSRETKDMVCLGFGIIKSRGNRERT